jgi:predicted RNase H-like nuclease (RuvC/YqgF family)
MVIQKLLSCGLAVLLSLGTQSLADLARQEAERRKMLEEQGIEAKVITGDPESLAPDGSLTTSTPVVTARTEKSRGSKSSGSSVRSYRSTIQKLDRSITKAEQRLRELRSKLEAARWALPKVGRLSSRSGNSDSQSRMQAEAEKLESQLKQMRQERAEAYDQGRKAGFLPGELDGKGIVP